MSLLKIDKEALEREVAHIGRMFQGSTGDDLAKKLGFTIVPRKEEKDNAYHKGTAVVFFYGEGRAHPDKRMWITAQKGKHSLVAHIAHDDLTRALIDALNRGC